MSKQQRAAVRAKAFAALTQKQQENLRWHAEQGSGICCEEKALIFGAEGSG